MSKRIKDSDKRVVADVEPINVRIYVLFFITAMRQNKK